MCILFPKFRCLYDHQHVSWDLSDSDILDLGAVATGVSARVIVEVKPEVNFL
jgi:hypothetical protein